MQATSLMMKNLCKSRNKIQRERERERERDRHKVVKYIQNINNSYNNNNNQP